MVRGFLRSYFIVIFTIFLVSSVFAARSNDNIWQELDESSIKRPESERTVIASDYKVFRVNKSNLNQFLENAPQEFSETARNKNVIVTLPLPDGTFSRFKIQYAPIMAPELAAKYPDIRSYTAQGVDSAGMTARISMSPSGFRAIIFSGYKTIVVDPYAQNDSTNYISYDKASVEGEQNFTCQTGDKLDLGTSRNEFLESISAPNLVSNGTVLRTYRLAIAATAEYTNVFRQTGDTDAQAKAHALEQQVIIMTRVNGVYERDLSIRMILVANNDALIYTNQDTDPYTNNDGSKMLTENQVNIDSVIGAANYDIGHIFSTGGGGIAHLSVPCSSRKAQGVTGLYNPRGDAFAIDYVAHEMGHQWGADHTFNGGTSNCGDGNRSAGSAFEPGSGVTIMGYAGICSTQDLARNSIDTFHIKSIESILEYVTSGFGSTCSVNVQTDNAVPSVTPVGGSSFNVPKETPFALTAAASDLNGDNVTYDWQEYDLGSTATLAPNSDSDGSARPIFRSYSPTASGTRYFPSLQYILNNANVPPSTYNCGRSTPCLIGELLPSIARTMNFRVIARDNRIGNGAINTAAVQVNVDGTSGPFQVTSPNTPVSLPANSVQTITWNVANTTNSSINTQNVKISLSTDGGQTFGTVLAASTPNDGSQTVTLPNVTTSQARIKIEAVGNIFFDVSDVDFTLYASSAPNAKPKQFDFDGDGKSDVSVFRPSNGVWYLLRSQAGFGASQFGISTDKTVAADYDGDGKTDIAVFRSGSWFWINSSTTTFNASSFGQTGDVPVTGDFDGDGKSELTVFRNGDWFIYQSSNNQVRITHFGQTGDKALTGDYDGDGKADLAVYRGGIWYISGSTQGFSAVSFGISTDTPVPADYDGDGKTDYAVYRGGVWYLLQSQAGFTGVQFGIASDVPSVADFDGDGKADISVFRNGTWFMLQSQSGFAAVSFGSNGDQPVMAR